MFLGYDHEARAAYRRALDLEPGRAITYRQFAWMLFHLGDMRQAKAMSDSGLAIDSTPTQHHYRVQAAAGDTAMLRRMLANAERLNINAAAIRSRLALARGDTAGARSSLSANAIPFDLAAAGLPDSALAILARRNPSIINWWTLDDPEFRLLRTNPRFVALRDAWRPAAANPAVR
jgi:tetratricopeptide (TPR) repeat protein